MASTLNLHLNHHHHRFYVRFSTLAQVRRFPINSYPPSHPVLCIFFSQLKLPHILNYTLVPCFSASASTFFTFYHHISACSTQSSLFLRSMCPNHLNLPCRTTSNTHSTPNRPNNSSFVFLSFNVTPHIHLTIILSALSNLRISSTFIAQVSLPYTITLCTHAL